MRGKAVRWRDNPGVLDGFYQSAIHQVMRVHAGDVHAGDACLLVAWGSERAEH